MLQAYKLGFSITLGALSALGLLVLALNLLMFFIR